MTNYDRALAAMDALRRATWFAEYLEKQFELVRDEERRRCAGIARRHESAAEMNTAAEQWACAKSIREAIESGEQ